VCPSNPYDAKGLLLASIRDPDPVLFFEPKRIYRAAKGEVPEGDYTVPLGKANVVRAGPARHRVAWGAMLYEALEAANQAAEAGRRRARSSICARSGRSTSTPWSRA
jgi:pyruvate dehydrogenase E1 component beta subunit